MLCDYSVYVSVHGRGVGIFVVIIFANAGSNLAPRNAGAIQRCNAGLLYKFIGHASLYIQISHTENISYILDTPSVYLFKPSILFELLIDYRSIFIMYIAAGYLLLPNPSTLWIFIQNKTYLFVPFYFLNLNSWPYLLKSANTHIGYTQANCYLNGMGTPWSA